MNPVQRSSRREHEELKLTISFADGVKPAAA